MEKRRERVIIAILIGFIVLNLISLFFSLNLESITAGVIGVKDLFFGMTTGLAKVMITIGSGTLNLHILSPENTTYSFGIGDPYNLGLNVSADFNVELWRYTLTDLKHNRIVYDNVAFTPNITFDAVRWSNRLEVFASQAGNDEVISRNVTFFVYVPNSAPYISLDSRIYSCEDSALHYYFNVSDNDEEIYTPSFRVDNDPKNIFHVSLSFDVNYTTRTWELFSAKLTKSLVGNYSQNISASDGQYSDSRQVNLTVIEINHAPNLEKIGVQTVWTRGENVFYKKVKASDIEDGNQDSGNLSFNLSFLNSEELFGIDGNGTINFSANENQLGVYNISLCVMDRGLQNINPNIGLCNQTGLPMSTCTNFSLTVTNVNRGPTITSYYPLIPAINVSGTDMLYFNITKYDPDGTIPDSYWYLDNISVAYKSGESFDEFRKSFGCGVSGVHKLRVDITDGFLNDSVEWRISVTNVNCVIAGPGGGGGGAGGCLSKWTCNNWNVCQSADKSRDSGLLAGADYRMIKKNCANNSWVDEVCGFQMRDCSDVNQCGTRINIPELINTCYYTENPSCSDGIKNCHGGSCELLVDCGGPCSFCPSCSDGIKNQNEDGVDCGGPCPWKCSLESPLGTGSIKNIFSFIDQNRLYSFSIILILVLVIVIIIIGTRIIHLNRKLGKK
jgi:hypothetical protein